MDTLVQTPRTTLKRRVQRGSYDRAVVNAILDEGLVCHIGFTVDGQPFVTPTTYARIGERLYIHGSVASRMLKNLATGVPICFTVTLLVLQSGQVSPTLGVSMSWLYGPMPLGFALLALRYALELFGVSDRHKVQVDPMLHV